MENEETRTLEFLIGRKNASHFQVGSKANLIVFVYKELHMGAVLHYLVPVTHIQRDQISITDAVSFEDLNGT